MPTTSGFANCHLIKACNYYSMSSGFAHILHMTMPNLGGWATVAPWNPVLLKGCFHRNVSAHFTTVHRYNQFTLRRVPVTCGQRPVQLA
jgi:hypothetical protein